MKKNLSKILFMTTILFSQPAFCAEKLIVLLDWFTNPDHAPLLVAQTQGFFQQEGLDVELIGPADPSDPPKLVAAGKANIAIGYQPQLLEQIEQGLPLIEIGTLIDKPLNSLVVLKDSPIHSIADLKNKKIGFSGSGMNSAMLKIMLEKHHLTLQDVEIINTHYDLTQALLSGKVDAVTGIMRNFEMIQLELANHTPRAFYPENNGMPTYSELIFIAKKSNDTDVRFIHFLKAVRLANQYLQKHPEECWQAFAKAHPESDDELNHKAWLATLPYFARDPAWVDGKKFMRFAKFMQSNGLINTVLPISTYIAAKE
jgi:putative hydroxymethylpyrimidine transport system substrate-binding protein